MPKSFSNKKHRGVMVTFSGVDGAGKSTVIDEVARALRHQFGVKVVVRRHRPCLLPILSVLRHGNKASCISAQTKPRSGDNKSTLSSLIRFFYYLTDYIFGQFYIYFKYMRKGFVVLYDRYYFDFIVDYKRSNIQLNPRLMKWFYCIIFKPQLNFYLYADIKTILKRKQELEKDEVLFLHQGYHQLFRELSKNRKEEYIIINNEKKTQTVSSVVDYIQREMFSA